MSFLQARSEEEKSRRRQAIVSAAKDLFYERGYGAAVDEIAQRARLSKATLYLYFRNKDELYLGAIKEGFRALERKLSRAAAPDGTVEENLERVLYAFVEHMLENRKFFRMTQHYLAGDFRERFSSHSDQLLETEIRRLLPHVVRIIERGMREGLFSGDVNPDDLTIIAWRMAAGILDLAVGDESASTTTGRWAGLFQYSLALLLEGAKATQPAARGRRSAKPRKHHRRAGNEGIGKGELSPSTFNEGRRS